MSETLTPKEYAIKLYKEAYSRYCTELSHEKNHLTAKSMVEWVAGHVLSYMGADRGKDFWGEVKYEASILKASDVFSNVEY